MRWLLSDKTRMIIHVTRKQKGDMNMRNIKKSMAVIIIFCMAFALLTGCGQGAGQKSNLTSETKVTVEEGKGVELGRDRTQTVAFNSNLKNSDITIAYVCADLTNEVFAMQVNEMIRYSKEIGINFVYTQASDDSQKITAMENYINMGVNAIILNCSNPPVMIDIIDAAKKAGIPVFCYDNDTPNSDAYWGVKNYDYGYMMAKQAADWINKTFPKDVTVNGAICHFGGQSELAVNREAGARAAIAELAPNAKIVGEFRAGSQPGGIQAGENFINMNKDIKFVIGLNDGGVLGVYEIFKANGYVGDDIGLFACDAITEALNAIKEKSIFRGTVSTEIVKVAVDFIDIAVGLAKGDPQFYGQKYYFNMIPVNLENIEEYEKSHPLPPNFLGGQAK